MKHGAYGALVERHQDEILAVERYIWRHPETGFREWNTQTYLAEIFEQAGYTLRYAGNIPGFYTDLDTGRPGPRILIMGEMDALLQPGHPEAVDGKAHSCGHNCQCAALVGTALALKEPGALDGLCGSIRLMAVPAEEYIEPEFREELREKGIIRYFSGKVEFLHRGYMDGCDICYLLHASCSWTSVFDCYDCNGCMSKEAVFRGVAAHAAACPHLGVNALYAATQGLQAINALRETFPEPDHVRVHPIITRGGTVVNAIPDEVSLSTFVRGASLESMEQTSKKVNRALAGAALSLGATVSVSDRPGYAPLYNDPGLVRVAGDVARELLPEDKIEMHKPWGNASTDMGDLSCLIRTIHPHIAGCTGLGHSDDYCVAHPEITCVLGAKIQVLLAVSLLENGAGKAKQVLEGPPLRYPNKEAYFAAMDPLYTDRELITYTETGADVQW